MKLASAKELNQHLRRERQVVVEDQDGSRWGFKIRLVGTDAWDPENKWYAKMMGSDPKGFQSKIGEAVSCPSRDLMRTILLDGTQDPEISESGGNGSVKVDDLLRRDVLARNLYAQIAQFAFEGLAKVEARKHAEPRPADPGG